MKVFSFTVPKKPNSWTDLERQEERFEIFHHFCPKIEWGPSGGKCFVERKVAMPKIERGTFKIL